MRDPREYLRNPKVVSQIVSNAQLRAIFPNDKTIPVKKEDPLHPRVGIPKCKKC